MNPKLSDLMTALTASTRINKVRWERLGENMYRTWLTPGFVRIGRIELPRWNENGDNQGEHWYYEFWVMNSAGEIAEEERFGEGSPGYREADLLFRAARSAAAGDGKNDVVNKMLSALAVS